jgi:hypothetical protein
MAEAGVAGSHSSSNGSGSDVVGSMKRRGDGSGV